MKMQTVRSAVKDVGSSEPSHAAGTVRGCGPCGKQFGSSSKKLNIQLPYNPAILLGIYPRELKHFHTGSSHHGAAEINLTRNYEVVGSIPGLAQWVKNPALP